MCVHRVGWVDAWFCLRSDCLSLTEDVVRTQWVCAVCLGIQRTKSKRGSNAVYQGSGYFRFTNVFVEY